MENNVQYKMREALESIYDMLSKPCIVIEEVRQACQKARAVLISTPPRNCDTVSGDDPYVYQSKWCKAVAGSVEPTKYCPNRSCVQCLFRWLVANVEGGAS